MNQGSSGFVDFIEDPNERILEPGFRVLQIYTSFLFAFSGGGKPKADRVKHDPGKNELSMKKEQEKEKKKKEARIEFSLSSAYRGFLNFSQGSNGLNIAGAKIWLFIWLEYQGNIKVACKG